MKKLILFLFCFPLLAAGPDTTFHSDAGVRITGGTSGTGLVFENGYPNSIVSHVASTAILFLNGTVQMAGIDPNSLSTAGTWFTTDSAGVGNKNTFFFPNATSDTITLTADDNPGVAGAAVKAYGHTSGSPDILEFYAGTGGTPNGKIDASGHWFMPNLATSSAAQTGTVCSGTFGQLTVDTTTTCLASTRKIKKNIDLLDIGINEVMKLKPVSYDLKKEMNHEGRQVGLVAEDVAEVDKRLVAMDDKGEPRAVRYQQLTAVLVKAIQEQQAEIRILKQEIQDLKNQIQ